MTFLFYLVLNQAEFTVSLPLSVLYRISAKGWMTVCRSVCMWLCGNAVQGWFLHICSRSGKFLDLASNMFSCLHYLNFFSSFCFESFCSPVCFLSIFFLFFCLSVLLQSISFLFFLISLFTTKQTKLIKYICLISNQK